MLKRLRKLHPILYSILAEGLFLGGMLTVSFLMVIFSGRDPHAVNRYWVGSVQEMAGFWIAVLLLAGTGRLWVLRRRGCGFMNGLLVGMYPLALIGYTAFTTMASRPDLPLRPLGEILLFFLNMILVGIAEETLFRGVIAQTLLEHYGASRAGIWKACILSGVLFGAAHLSNLAGAAAFGVLMQSIFAAALGTLFAAIYFRTGNLWVVAFLHAAMDIVSMLIGGLYGTVTIAESVSSYDASLLMSMAVYLIPTIFLLRRSKLHEVKLHCNVKSKREK